MCVNVYGDEEYLYSVSIDGEVVLECLSEEEVGKLTLAELNEIAMKQVYA